MKAKSTMKKTKNPAIHERSKHDVRRVIVREKPGQRIEEPR